MMKLLTENILAKLLSVLIAFLLWVAIVDEPELIETVTVPIEYRNLASNLDLAGDAPSRIQLQVRGPRGRLNEVSPDRTNLVLDLGEMTSASSRTFTVQENSINLPANVSLVRAMPSQVRVKLERRIFKDLPVTISYEKTLETSFNVIAADIYPQTIKVVGPESRINAATAVTTEPIGPEHLAKPGPFRVNVLLSDPELSIVGAPMVTLSIKTSQLP
jgi:YbbR domain-containing protein